MEINVVKLHSVGTKNTAVLQFQNSYICLYWTPLIVGIELKV